MGMPANAGVAKVKIFERNVILSHNRHVFGILSEAKPSVIFAFRRETPIGTKHEMRNAGALKVELSHIGQQGTPPSDEAFRPLRAVV